MPATPEHVLPTDEIVVQRVDIKFPPLPRTVMELSRLIAERSSEPDLDRLTKIIQADPIVSAQLLRRINSVFYAMRGRISDVPRAVRLLGFKDVCSIALASGMMQLADVLRSEEQVAVYGMLNRISLGSGILCDTLAREAKLGLHPIAFTVGLMSQLGRFIMIYNLPDRCSDLWSRVYGEVPTPEAERAIFGVDHATLALEAARHWKLPADLAAVIGHYLTPSVLTDASEMLMSRCLQVALSIAEPVCLLDAAPEGLSIRQTLFLSSFASQAHVTLDPLRSRVLETLPKMLEFVDAVVKE